MREALEQISADLRFWENLSPPGFKVCEWRRRLSATLISPTGKTWHVTPDLLHHIRRAFGLHLVAK